MVSKRRKAQGVLVAIFAAFALLWQGAGGMAQARAGDTIVVCTAHGAKTVAVDAAGAPASPQKAPCPHCDHCLAAALALAAQAPTAIQPALYAHAAGFSSARLRVAPPATAPPRPPSIGPPAA